MLQTERVRIDEHIDTYRVDMGHDVTAWTTDLLPNYSTYKKIEIQS
jgi:hypothetical protein